MNFPNRTFPLGAGGNGGLTAEQQQIQNMEKAMSAAMESCVGKSMISGVMGFGLGAMFGLFMSSVSISRLSQSSVLPSLASVD